MARTWRDSAGRRVGTALAAAALLFLTACTAPDTAATSAPAATVEVDVYSGRANPTVALSPAAATAVREFIEEREDEAVLVEEPGWPLGFRGFLVTLGDGSRETLRVLEQSVYIDADEGAYFINDPAGAVFGAIWLDIMDDLDPDVVVAIEQSQ